MSLIAELHQDVKLAIQSYVSRYPSEDKIPADRRKDLKLICAILHKENDPLRLRAQLIEYLPQVSAFYAWIPFLEINQLRNPILQVLERPCYQEVAILTRLLQEQGTLASTSISSIQPISQDVEIRLKSLEHQLGTQAWNIVGEKSRPFF
jgi:hypothetical protein